MAMAPFYELFRDLAFKEMRSATVNGWKDLPDGEYGFLELYCDEVDCDCRRVLLNVVSPTAGDKVLATINYGWESLEFYKQWSRGAQDAAEMKDATLDPLNPQSQYSPALLRLFEFILTDEAYVERLKSHYALFKGAIHEKNQVKQAQRSQWKKIRRRKRR